MTHAPFWSHFQSCFWHTWGKPASPRACELRLWQALDVYFVKPSCTIYVERLVFVHTQTCLLQCSKAIVCAQQQRIVEAAVSLRMRPSQVEEKRGRRRCFLHMLHLLPSWLSISSLCAKHSKKPTRPFQLMAEAEAEEDGKDGFH